MHIEMLIEMHHDEKIMISVLPATWVMGCSLIETECSFLRRDAGYVILTESPVMSALHAGGV